ncbi:MAG: tetratricopeptide repeat protein [Candidatus Pacebacteria bacterium]|nr:tetratricopeptide repeat protein [Candidatus Paceibacterota bacterium]
MSITTEYIPEPVQSHDDGLVREHKSAGGLEMWAFYILLATVIIAPLAFLPTPFIALDAVKTAVIALGTAISAALYGVMAYRKRGLVLPPRGVFWSGVVVAGSLLLSTLLSIHASKSFFGQGFELGTGSFSLLMFVVALVVFAAIRERIERVTVLYAGMIAAFLGLTIFHGARLVFGPDFAKLGVLSSPVGTVLGTWFDLATYAGIIGVVVVAALMVLPLSGRMKMFYSGLLALALIVAVLVNSMLVWVALTIVFAATALFTTLRTYSGGGFGVFIKSIAWLPLIVAIISGAFFWKGTSMAGPVIDSMGIEYTALNLPWQTSLDVAAGAIKESPLFGIGPNQFNKAYIAFKPMYINSTIAWNAEFNYAFSLIATAVVAQGVIGLLAWATFFVFLAVLFVRALARLPSDPYARFAIISSVFGSLYLWIVSFISVPSHVMVYFTYVLTAIAIGMIVKANSASAYSISPRIGERSRPVFNTALIAAVAVMIIWGAVYVKNSVALAYFGSGVKALNSANDPIAADSSFRIAQRLNPLDSYLRARVEAGIVRANQLIVQANSLPTGTTTQALIEEINAVVNASAGYAQQAIASDRNYYYNHISSARVLELASNMKMTGAYENAVNAYVEAIKLNPYNPTLYLNLAQLQASGNKLDDALKSVGASIQLKNDYLDAIFLLSQITAAQGNLKDAIIAAQVGTEINPQSPVLFFQLGLLQYTNKEYQGAAKSLESAVKLQPDYANAQYFLGLAYARIGDLENATAQFENLVATNPDNEEVSLILGNLRAGKSPFADAQPPVTPTPEKRSTLPIKEEKKK